MQGFLHEQHLLIIVVHASSKTLTGVTAGKWPPVSMRDRLSSGLCVDVLRERLLTRVLFFSRMLVVFVYLEMYYCPVP